MRKLHLKFSSVYFIIIGLIVILFLLPTDFLFGMALKPLGYLLMFLIILAIILFIAFSYFDVKNKNKKTLFLRILVLLIGIFFWYVRRFIY